MVDKAVEGLALPWELECSMTLVVASLLLLEEEVKLPLLLLLADRAVELRQVLGLVDHRLSVVSPFE